MTYFVGLRIFLRVHICIFIDVCILRFIYTNDKNQGKDELMKWDLDIAYGIRHLGNYKNEWKCKYECKFITSAF